MTVLANPASSTPPADLRLDLGARNYLRAVVFDANAFGRARPDLVFLGDLAKRLHTIDIETWVPEPVAWELGHLAEFCQCGEVSLGLFADRIGWVTRRLG